MALDNNHVTKLGELKQLIDGLWGKVTTAISNAVSGLLSKSEAAETYATKGEIPTVPTNVSAFENDVGYITEAEVPEYELTADKIAAVGELSNNTSGIAECARRATTSDGKFLNSVPAGKASFEASSQGYQSNPHHINLYAENGRSGVCGGIEFDGESVVTIDNAGNAEFKGTADYSSKAYCVVDDGTATRDIYISYTGASLTSFNKLAGWATVNGKLTIKDLDTNAVRKLMNGESVGSSNIPTYIDAYGNPTACGAVNVAHGGTGKTTVTAGNFLKGNGTSALTERTPAQVLSDIGAAASSHNHDSMYMKKAPATVGSTSNGAYIGPALLVAYNGTFTTSKDVGTIIKNTAGTSYNVNGTVAIIINVTSSSVTLTGFAGSKTWALASNTHVSVVRWNGAWYRSDN